MTTTPPEPPDDDGTATAFGVIEPIEIQEEMERSFLDYSMSVIVQRALPDVRDGLKPVHRRILWGMYDVGARPDRPFMKCARVTGEVMGKYHPHGNQAIYDALARMAQDFSLRHPLVAGHGNFGSPDFGPAAERYCVTGDTRIRTARGTLRIDELAAVSPDGEADIDVKVLDRHADPVLATKLFHSGEQPTLRLRTDEGYSLTGTTNHPVLCLEPIAGVPVLLWRLLGEISPGTKVVLNRTPDEGDLRGLSERECRLATLAGAFVSEGSISDRRARFNNTDLEFFHEVVDAFDEIVGGPRSCYSRRIRSGRLLHELDVQHMGALMTSPLREMVGLRGAEKVVPSFVWEGSPGFKASFLQALFEGDGCISLAERHTARIFYSTRSERLAHELQLLLLEFGIASRVRCDQGRGEWKLSIDNRRDVRLFEQRVNFFSRKRKVLAAALATVPVASRAMSSDQVPFLSAYLRSEGSRGQRKWLAKHNLDRIERWERDGADILSRVTPEAAAVAEELVGDGSYYATVTSVEPAGVQPVYSIRVDSDAHAFLGNGFVNHNTECRLAPLAMRMLADIDQETVDFDDNYSGEFTEPSVLPSRFPNLLVNGSQGIAVGMATNIPPHNLGEVIDATVHLIDHPGATPDDLMAFVTGPDFPTGGLIMGRAGIMDAYRTGRGSIRVRAVAEIEEGARADRIVITQLPYQVGNAAVLGKIKELVDSREIEGISGLNDETAKGETRLVITLKKDAPALIVLNNLYKRTPLQTSFAMNAVALVDGVPRTLNLAQMLQAYIDHQVEVITRRSEYRLRKAQERAHIVEGLIKALDMIDEIIAAIRGSADRPAAMAALMADPFGFTETQAEHILDMRLSRLTQLGRTELDDELAELRRRIAELEAILGDRSVLMGVIKDELAEVRADHASERRSQITFEPGEIDIEDLIDDEDLVVTLTAKGYVKTVAADVFRTQGRGGRGVAGANLRDEDYVAHILTTTAHAYLLFFSNLGRVYRLKAHEIPMKERTARGTAIVNLLPLQPGEHIQAIIDTRDYESNQYLFFATKQGQVKKTKFTEYDSSLRAGIIAINLRDGDELVRVIPANDADDLFMVSRQGMTVRFDQAEVRAMGRSAAGVRGMKLREGDEVVSCDVAADDATILIVTDAGYGKRTKLEHFSRKSRGIQGVKGIKLTARRGYVVAAFMVSLEDEIFVIASGGVLIRVPVRNISSQGRDATGVRIMNLDEGQAVAAVAKVLQADDA